MKLYQKIIGITIAFLLASVLVLTFLTIYYNNINLFIIAAVGLVPVSLILTIILMLTYKNHMLRKVFLIGMLFFLALSFILEIIGTYQIIVYLSFLFLIYLVAVNIIIHFLRFDLNLIIVIFLLLIGLYMKSLHSAGSGIVMTISMMLIAAFLILIAFRAFKIKDNRYLSIVMFSCSVILALQFITMV